MSDNHPHIMPLKTYFTVYGILLVLTGLTVAVSQLGLPSTTSIVVAMAVAAVKAFFVATWFMHLKYERSFNIFVFGASFWFMSVFFIFTMTDLSSRGRVLTVTDNFEQRMDEAIEAERLNPPVAHGAAHGEEHGEAEHDAPMEEAGH